MTMVKFSVLAIEALMLASSLLLVAKADDTIDERSILQEFYEATGGAAWTNNQGWAENAPDLCDWHGVLCLGQDDLPADIEQRGRDRDLTDGIERRRQLQSDDDSNVVIGLSLVDNFLQGQMPDSLWSLPLIQYIDVSYNVGLELSFVRLDYATEIHTIKMHNTDVTTITGLDAAAATLESFHLSGAKISSAVPTELLALTSLKFLHMSNCDLQGPLPAEINKMTAIRELNMAENSLTGTLPDLSELIHLRVLAFSKNTLGGSIPDSLMNLKMLHEVFLDNNNFFGPLPDFRSQGELYKLHVQSNDLRGPIPGEFLRATMIDNTKPLSVNLANNRLTGVVPADLDVLSPIQMLLDLADNQFTDVAQELCDNEKWNDGAVLTATEPCWGILCPIGTFSKTGRASKHHDCVECASVQYAGSTHCYGSDDVSTLQALYVATGGETSWKNRDNWMSLDGEFCTWYGVECNDAGQVEHLRLAHNGLTGTVPDTIFNLQSMKRLDVSQNEDVVLPFLHIAASPAIETVDISYT